MQMNRTVLDYLVSDFLGIHYSKCPKALKQIKSKLLHQSAVPVEPSHIPAFALNGVLVAVQNNGSEKPTQLVVLNPHEQTYQMYRLRPLPVAQVPGTDLAGRVKFWGEEAVSRKAK